MPSCTGLSCARLGEEILMGLRDTGRTTMYFQGWSLFLYLTIWGPCQSFWMRAPWSENCFTLTDTGRRACVSITAISYSDCRMIRM
jgi:hypothetical protein